MLKAWNSRAKCGLAVPYVTDGLVALWDADDFMEESPWVSRVEGYKINWNVSPKKNVGAVFDGFTTEGYISKAETDKLCSVLAPVEWTLELVLSRVLPSDGSTYAANSQIVISGPNNAANITFAFGGNGNVPPPVEPSIGRGYWGNLFRGTWPKEAESLATWTSFFAHTPSESFIRRSSGQPIGVRSDYWGGSGDEIYIGFRRNASTGAIERHYRGEIMNIRFYDRKLSDEEIAYNCYVDKERFNIIDLLSWHPQSGITK